MVPTVSGVVVLLVLAAIIAACFGKIAPSVLCLGIAVLLILALGHLPQ